MRTLYTFTFFCCCLLPINANAAPGEILILSPTHETEFPRAAPTEGRNAFHIPVSFATKCFDSRYQVKWGFGSDTRGTAEFVDQGSIQYTDKLPEGRYIFWVASDCTEANVKFKIR